jgi:hypothetical protein
LSVKHEAPRFLTEQPRPLVRKIATIDCAVQAIDEARAYSASLTLKVMTTGHVLVRIVSVRVGNNRVLEREGRARVAKTWAGRCQSRLRNVAETRPIRGMSRGSGHFSKQCARSRERDERDADNVKHNASFE